MCEDNDFADKDIGEDAGTRIISNQSRMVAMKSTDCTVAQCKISMQHRYRQRYAEHETHNVTHSPVLEITNSEGTLLLIFAT